MATEVRQSPATGLPVRIRGITDWYPGAPPREVSDTAQPNGVRWIDVDVLEPEPPDSVASALLELLAPHCRHELDQAMVEDLLDVADRREGERYTECRIRSLSAFRASTKRLNGAGGELTFQPIEFLAGDEWVITCWHTRRTYQGAAAVSEDEPPESRGDVLEAVSERWVDGGESAGDLATMILHELTLTHREACFAIRGWLEEWELRLYLHNETDKEGLERLWGLMAQLREWIQPLNRPGITEDSSKAWFCGCDHRLVSQVDDQGVDRALIEVKDLANTLRDTFQVLSVRLLEEQRDRREQLQRRIEIAAAAFLVPTLVVGFYGANTKVPGQGTWAGFWGMVVVLVVLSVVSVAAVWILQGRRGDRS
jgi:hypothetical protein